MYVFQNVRLLTDDEMQREQASRLKNAEKEFAEARATEKIATQKLHKKSDKKVSIFN